MAEVQQGYGIENFYKFVGEGKLMGAKCNKCGAVMLPPRPVCSKCYSKDLQWSEVKGSGKLMTYTVIHVSPKQFEAYLPYAIGIVRFEDGTQLLGMIRNIEPDKLKIRMDLVIDFEKPSTTQAAQWPTWPRYYFKPL